MADDTKEGSGSLALGAYASLKGQILDLELRPGQRLVERDLAAALEISRIPLREALRALESEGLVVIVPRQGAMVAPFSAVDVRNLFDVRESVEALAARLAAQRATGDQLRTAQRQLVASRTAVERGDSRAAESANADFHETIIEMAGNPLLESMMQPLNARVRWLFRLTNDDLDDVQMCGEHEQMYQAIAIGEADLAARLAYEHVHATRAGALAKASTWSLVALDPVEITRTRQRERPASARSAPR